MDVILPVLIGFFPYAVRGVSVPPAICFEQFKWQDCGMAPKAVLYYYKSGSRCEVGMWRGCLPNPNMFADEYECVQTCIFTVRARPEDFHGFQAELGEDSDDYSDTTTDMPTTGTGTVGINITETVGEKGEGVTEDGGATTAEGEPAEGEAAEGEAAEGEAAEGEQAAPAEGEEHPDEGGEAAPAEGEDAAPAEGEDAAPAEGEKK